MIFFSVGSNGSTSGASSNSSSNKAAILSAYASVGGADSGAFATSENSDFFLLYDLFLIQPLAFVNYEFKLIC